MTICNAKIDKTMLGREDHGILTAFLYLDYGGFQQGFGGYTLDQYDKETKCRIGTAFGTEFIAQILKVLEVSSWEQLPGTHCRARIENNLIRAIGHILKDQWFDPKVVAESMLEL